MENLCCPFCNIKVAIADPDSVTICNIKETKKMSFHLRDLKFSLENDKELKREFTSSGLKLILSDKIFSLILLEIDLLMKFDPKETKDEESIKLFKSIIFNRILNTAKKQNKNNFSKRSEYIHSGQSGRSAMAV